MNKIILLSRVSTGHQDLEQQTEQLKSYAKSIGYNDNDIIIIEDKESAVKLSEEERQGLNKMKEVISNYTVTDVVIYELSRLSRVPKILYSVRDYLVQNKIQLHILNPRIKLLKDDYSIDESANVVFSLFCSLSENEGYIRKQRTARGKDKARRANKYIGGQISYGYSVNRSKEFEINEEEAKVVRRIFNDYQTKTVVEIAKDLVFEGIFNLSVNSAASLIRNILHRRAYTGEEVEVKGYKQKLPAIITKEDYEAVENKIEERKKYGKTQSKHGYLCRNLVFNINNEYLRPLYCHSCYALLKMNKYEWETLSINMQFLDDIAFHYAVENKKRMPGKDLMRYKVELQKELESVSRKVLTIDNKVQEENEKILKFEMRYASGKMSESTLDLLVEKVQQDIKKLEADKGTLEDDRGRLRKKLSNLSDSDYNPLLGPLSDLTVEDKERIVHEEIEKIILIKGEKRYNYTLGIQFFNGHYVLIDCNPRCKKVWNENGDVVEIKNS